MSVNPTRRFLPQNLFPVVVIRGGKLVKKSSKPRVFFVKPLEELKKLPGGIVPLGMNLAKAAEALNTDGRSLLREGFTADGVNVDDLFKSIKACGMRPLFTGMGLRDKLKHGKPLEEMTEEEKAEAEEKFHIAVFNCIVGRIGDPDKVLEEFSLMKTLNDKETDDEDKAAAAAAYLAAMVPDKTHVAERAALLADSMSSFISSTLPDDPSGKRGRWLLIELISYHLYQQRNDMKLDAEFFSNTLRMLGYDTKEVFAWLSVYRKETTSGQGTKGA